MHERSIQEYLFQQIREKLPADASLADAVADLLYLSTDSVYRRIRGETPLVLEEARVLCEAYGISLDALLKAAPGTVSLTAVEVDSEHRDFHQYLTGIHAALKGLAAAREKEVWYLTKDIPLFYNFLFRPLFAFRYFFWMKSILQHPDFVHRAFQPSLLPPEIEETGRAICRLYNSLPSTEIWNTECINSTIAQVEYYREAGYFESGKDIEAIYDSLLRLVDHLRIQAEEGCKFEPGESPSSRPRHFRFFYNRVVLGDNTILALADGKKTAYLSYDVLNYLATSDEALCRSIHDKMQLLMRRSTLLSHTGDKPRNIFFNLLIKKIPASINPSAP